MNKQNLWFLTLFSLILVLGIYYVTMPNELLLGKNESTVKTTAQKSTKKNSGLLIQKNPNHHYPRIKMRFLRFSTT